jgi:hypothetical protein
LKVNSHFQLDASHKVNKGKENIINFEARNSHCRCLKGNNFVSSSEVYCYHSDFFFQYCKLYQC